MKGYLVYDENLGSWYNNNDNPYSEAEIIGFANFIAKWRPRKDVETTLPAKIMPQRIEVCKRYSIRVVEVITE